MKVTEHVEHLLRKGRSPDELVELGFHKAVVTRVHRRLRQERASLRAKVPKTGPEVKGGPQAATVSAAGTAPGEQELTHNLQKADSLVNALPEVVALVAAAQEFGADKRLRCPHQDGGRCTLWTWTSQDEIPKDIGEPVLVENKEPSWHIKPSPFYCAMCTAFLEGRMDDIADNLADDPLYGARHQITCMGCGSEGRIATAIKCTECGKETWWGWFPKQ